MTKTHYVVLGFSQPFTFTILIRFYFSNHIDEQNCAIKKKCSKASLILPVKFRSVNYHFYWTRAMAAYWPNAAAKNRNKTLQFGYCRAMLIIYSSNCLQISIANLMKKITVFRHYYSFSFDYYSTLTSH